MDDALKIWGLVINAIAAMASFAVAAISLYQSRQAYRKKIALRAYVCTEFPKPSGLIREKPYKALKLEFSNNGLQAVCVVDWGIVIKGKGSLSLADFGGASGFSYESGKGNTFVAYGQEVLDSIKEMDEKSFEKKSKFKVYVTIRAGKSKKTKVENYLDLWE